MFRQRLALFFPKVRAFLRLIRTSRIAASANAPSSLPPIGLAEERVAAANSATGRLVQPRRARVIPYSHNVGRVSMIRMVRTCIEENDMALSPYGKHLTTAQHLPQARAAKTKAYQNQESASRQTALKIPLRVHDYRRRTSTDGRST